MADDLVRVSLARRGDVARLTWTGQAPVAELAAALRAACDAAIDDGLRRVEVALPAGDRSDRHALHRAGFRLEGVGRRQRESGPGIWVDVAHYARLDDDPMGGPERFTAVMNSVTARKRLIAHALVTDAAGRLLLCETTFKPDWELPGGIVELGESPATALSREMREEMGWAPAVGGLLVADWLRPYLGWEDALELVFATAVVSDADARLLIPDGREIGALHWVEAAAVAAVMTPFGAARALSALRAAAEGRTLYTEGGHPV